jgi:hypothetical protein
MTRIQMINKLNALNVKTITKPKGETTGKSVQNKTNGYMKTIICICHTAILANVF